MPLRPLPYREVKRRLEAAGFRIVGQTGSHVKFVKHTDNLTLIAIVPTHSEIVVGTLRGILRQASISPDDFEKL